MAVQDAPNPIIHRVSMNPGNEQTKAKTELDRVLEDKELRAAKRYSAAELEKMALESENEAARLRGEPPKHKSYGGEEMTDEEKAKKEEERKRLLDSAKALIDSGMEPKQVGQMLLGLVPTQGAAGYPPAQGMGLDDVIKIVNLVTEKKETSELKAVIASLDKKVDDLARGGGKGKDEAKPIDPITFARQQAEMTKAYVETLKDLGIIKEPVVTTEKGEPLEVVKEKHRHEERMEEVKTDRSYKETLGETLSNIPERIGRGIAGQISEGEEEESNKGSALESLICQEEGCGTKIYITPTSGNQVTCPKCGSIYTRKETVETKE